MYKMKLPLIFYLPQNVYNKLLFFLLIFVLFSQLLLWQLGSCSFDLLFPINIRFGFILCNLFQILLG